MEKIKLKFSATPSLFPTNGIVVVLTLDEKGKSYKAKLGNEIFNSLLGEQKELSPLPKRVLDAFTENAINKNTMDGSCRCNDSVAHSSLTIQKEINHMTCSISPIQWR